MAVAGVSADELVARGRRVAESLMTDVVLVSRASGRPVTDPETGVVSVPSVEVYEGIGRMQAREEWAAGDEIYLGGEAINDNPKRTDGTGFIKYEVPLKVQRGFPFIKVAS